MGNNKKQRINNSNRRLAIILFGIGILVAITIGSWQLYLAYTTPNEIATQISETLQIPESSSVKSTIINQEVIDCEILSDGRAGLSYYNKTLGFSVGLPNVNWSINEDDGYYVSNIGLIENDNFMGGIIIHQKYSPDLLISIFDDSEKIYVEDFLTKIAQQVTKKIEWSSVAFNFEYDDSGSSEIFGKFHGSNFYIYQKALRTDDKIYLIHYPNVEFEYPQNIFDEIDEIYLSINIFPTCEI